MNYVSTRGRSPAVDSAQALLAGLAPDGGLYVPAEPLAPLPPADGFAGTMRELLARFFPELPQAARDAAVQASLARFDDPADPTPIRDLGDTAILELFHGPTLAFKDVALTLLPHLLAAAAQAQGTAHAHVLTATSGDTGSAAMNGFAGAPGATLVALYPATGISEIQRRQMVCCPGDNVAAIAVRGNFDDAQAAVKAAFLDPALNAAATAARTRLTSANSINIGRLFPQIAYYLHAAHTLARPFDVIVPTGNFGDILAAWYARALGAPIGRLVVASNQNRVVADFIRTGRYDARRDFTVTNSPSMDILRSSNVERLLWLLTKGNDVELRTWMAQLQAEGWYQIQGYPLHDLQAAFAAGWATPAQTEAAIADAWETAHLLLDPHTAVAWHVAHTLPPTGRATLIAATASPWKFPATVLRALTGAAPADDFAAADALADFTGLAPAPLIDRLRDAPIRHTLTLDPADLPAHLLATLPKP